MTKLLRFDGVGIAPLDAEKAPKWNQLFLPGSFHRSDFPDGVITFDGAFFASLVDNWRREGARPLPVDYFHRGETGDDLPLEEKIAAGWISDLQARPDGVWGLIGWTDKARGFIAADELRYLSPTFTVDGLDRSTGQSQGPSLFGAALLNDPYLKELPRVAASAAAPTPQPQTKEQQMDPMQQLAALHTALGFPPGMKHEEAITKAGEMAKKFAAPADGAKSEPAATEALATDAAAPSVDDKEPMAMSSMRKSLELANTERVSLAARIAMLESEKAHGEVLALTTKLLTERRITPAQREEVGLMAKAIGLAKAADFFGKMTALSIGEVGSSGTSEAASSDEARKAYFAEVDEVKAKHSLSFVDAAARVNASKPALAKSISTLTPKPSAS